MSEDQKPPLLEEKIVTTQHLLSLRKKPEYTVKTGTLVLRGESATACLGDERL
ncbi:MAG: hypothetical protein ACK41E_01450 [Deinococcales bacterium]